MVSPRDRIIIEVTTRKVMREMAEMLAAHAASMSANLPPVPIHLAFLMMSDMIYEEAARVR